MKKKAIELEQKIKDKLAEAVELWADENLIGKPQLLATGMYYQLENAMKQCIEDINEEFPD